MDPEFLALDDILDLHTQQIERYGGTNGIRDRAGLESAIATPQATFGGDYLHSSIPNMAAAYLFHICQNHPFLDGNKRTAAHTAIAFLMLNGWEFLLTEDELIDLVLGVASGVIDKAKLTQRFESCCQPLQS